MEAEHVVKEVHDLPTEDVVKLDYVGEVRAQQELVGEGTFEPMVEGTFGSRPSAYAMLQ